MSPEHDTDVMANGSADQDTVEIAPFAATAWGLSMGAVMEIAGNGCLRSGLAPLGFCVVLGSSASAVGQEAPPKQVPSANATESPDGEVDAADAGDQEPAVVVLDAPPPSSPTPESASAPRGPSKVVADVRVGLLPYGRGTMSFDGYCRGDCLITPVPDASGAATEKTVGMFGFEVLSVTGPIRLGGGAWFVPHVQLEQDHALSTASEGSLGWEFSLPFIFEVLSPVSDRVGIAVRGAVGPQLIAGMEPSDLYNDVEAAKNFCDDAEAADLVSKCRPGSFVRWSPMLAGGIGPVFQVDSDLALRVDLMAQTFNQRLFRLRAEGPGWEMEQSYSYRGVRLWVMVAMEAGE